MKTPLGIAACTLIALGGGGLAAAEITGAFGDGAVDEHVVREPVHEVVIDAEDGDVTLARSADDVHVRVRRNHLINSPTTSHRVADGVLTLKTRCPIGFVTCRSDYRVGVPSGVVVTVSKPSGQVDALAVGGEVTELPRRCRAAHPDRAVAEPPTGNRSASIARCRFPVGSSAPMRTSKRFDRRCRSADGARRPVRAAGHPFSLISLNHGSRRTGLRKARRMARDAVRATVSSPITKAILGYEAVAVVLGAIVWDRVLRTSFEPEG